MNLHYYAMLDQWNHVRDFARKKIVSCKSEFIKMRFYPCSWETIGVSPSNFHEEFQRATVWTRKVEHKWMELLMLTSRGAFFVCVRSEWITLAAQRMPNSLPLSCSRRAFSRASELNWQVELFSGSFEPTKRKNRVGALKIHTWHSFSQQAHLKAASWDSKWRRWGTILTVWREACCIFSLTKKRFINFLFIKKPSGDH